MIRVVMFSLLFCSMLMGQVIRIEPEQVACGLVGFHNLILSKPDAPTDQLFSAYVIALKSEMRQALQGHCEDVLSPAVVIVILPKEGRVAKISLGVEKIDAVPIVGTANKMAEKAKTTARKLAVSLRRLQLSKI